MVTKIIDSDGEDVPAPSFTVFWQNGTENRGRQFFYRKARKCVREKKNFSCFEDIENTVDHALKTPSYWKKLFHLYTGWYYQR